MIVDVSLLVFISSLTVGLTVWGGYLSTSHPVARAGFIIAGMILTVLVIVQGIRQINSQSASDNSLMTMQQRIREERHLSDAKIDGLFALLKPQPLGTGAMPNPVKPRVAPRPSQPEEQTGVTASASWVRVSHQDRPSTRADAPFAQELIVQVSKEVSPVRLAITCDQNIVDGKHLNGGAFTMYSIGVLTDNPRVFVLGYQTPPLTPAAPLDIEIWTKEKAKCEVQMF